MFQVPVAVPFNGQDIYVVSSDTRETSYVLIKRVCDSIGLEWEGQRQRIKRDPVLSKGTSVIQVPSKGGVQKTLGLALNRVAHFFATIDASRLKDPKIRNKIVAYQERCADVLDTYWFELALQKRAIKEPDPTRRGGPADIFNPPRQSKEVQVYSPPVTHAEFPELMGGFMETRMSQILTHFLANSDFVETVRTNMADAVVEKVNAIGPKIIGPKVRTCVDKRMPKIKKSVSDQVFDKCKEYIDQTLTALREELSVATDRKIRRKLAPSKATITEIHDWFVRERQIAELERQQKFRKDSRKSPVDTL